jgi:hypothetical protein
MRSVLNCSLFGLNCKYIDELRTVSALTAATCGGTKLTSALSMVSSPLLYYPVEVTL